MSAKGNDGYGGWEFPYRFDYCQEPCCNRILWVSRLEVLHKTLTIIFISRVSSCHWRRQHRHSGKGGSCCRCWLSWLFVTMLLLFYDWPSYYDGVIMRTASAPYCTGRSTGVLVLVNWRRSWWYSTPPRSTTVYCTGELQLKKEDVESTISPVYDCANKATIPVQ